MSAKAVPPGSETADPTTTTTDNRASHDMAPAPAPATDDAPDPDEDDLDDLDDMLEEFSAVKLDPKKPAAAGPEKASTSSSGGATTEGKKKEAAVPPAATTDASDAAALEDFSEEDFAKQLQAGMEELMGGMGGMENNPQLQAQFENIFKEFGPGGALGAEPAASSSSRGAATASANTKTKPTTTMPKTTEGVASQLSTDATFQDTIRRTMNRMKESGDQATAAAATAAEGSSEADFIAEMMKAMGDLPAGAGGEGSDEDMTKMLMGMMEQLTTKEILYEPMRELDEKFPAWMEKNKGGLSGEEREKYGEQQRLVREMVAKFEERTYRDENAADREYIVERMQKMQAAGSPPPDLVGDMPSAKEVFDGPEEGCAPQ